MIRGIAHVCFTVRNLDAALAFYCEGLGLRHAFDFRRESGERYGVYLHAGGRNFIELFQGTLAEPAPGQAYRHLCLEVDNIEESVAAMRVRGIDVSPVKMGADHSWQAWITDPDGNRMDQKEMLFELQPAGQPAPGNSQEYTLRPKYKDHTQQELTWDWNGWRWIPATPGNGVRYPFNGVIYAEGNVRIRGRLPMDTQYGGVRLTVVSRGTIYIDGNLIKGQPYGGQGASKSQIALLARDYVCLNTTSFVRIETNALWDSVARNGNPPFAWWLPPNAPDQSVRLYWDFGLSPRDDARVMEYYKPASNGQDNRVALFLRHQAYGGPATFQWRVNGTPYRHTLSGPFSGVTNAEFYPLLNSGLNAWEVFADARALPFGLDPVVVGQNFPARVSQQDLTGEQNEIEIQPFDPGPIPQAPHVQTTGGTYQIAAAAIQPLDVQITALIYAEHRSWFVIPGVFFQDQQSGDPVMQNYATGGGAWRYPKDREPLDVQIHVVGAIAEGQAASLQDVTLWTAHWRGANRTAYEADATDADPTFVKRGGINYAFDPTLITLTREVRFSPDEPAYFLPGPPRLPVCPGLVYFGERPVR
ncbi:MAG: VOC family protein [Armatimonadota bacterium]|nr:VOC family protein [Armatimonadota bacterium]